MKKPIVLSIAAHDPTGGAGIQADIESITANGCHALSVITALTEQTLTHGVTGIHPQDIKIFNSQLESIFKEYSIDAIKIGVIATIKQLENIISVLRNTDIPIVLDPVIQSTSGFLFYDNTFIECLIHKLIPLCSVITPNQQEVSQLYSYVKCTNAYQFLEKINPKSLLITSSKIEENSLTHTFVIKNNESTYDYKKLPGEYHGSGCTLSSALATQLALNEPLELAVKKALDYTWESLNSATININNTYIPNRFFNQ